jgi:hypothetical protein
MSTAVATTGSRLVRGAIPERVTGAVGRRRSDESGSWAGAIRQSRGNRLGPGTVIAAFVRARLLGIKILTLDARVVLLSADAASDLPSVASQANVVAPQTGKRSVEHRDGQRGDLAYAVRLLEEGSMRLDEVRASRDLDTS